MKLVRYCVMNFRSVKNSGWIDCDDVTTLVGVNESGKSNLLLALWKLNPARGGEIDILHDMPVSELSTLRNRKNEVKFISAEFEMEKDCAEVISKNTGYKCEEGMRVIVSRFYDGRYEIDFPDGDPEVMICAEKETEQEIEEIESKEELENEENNQELIVVLSTFDTDEKGGDGGFNPNDTYANWQWYLVKTADKKSWEIINWGY